MLPSSVDTFKSSQRFKIRPHDLGWFSLFVVIGGLAVCYPYVALAFVAAAAVFGLGWVVVHYFRRARLELWQALVLIALTGYILLNYGFENLTLHVGALPIIISYGLMYSALALAILAHPDWMIRAMKEPTMICVAAMIVFAFLHLLIDLPLYGLWAVRDSSMFLDGIFLLLGCVWARRQNGATDLAKWLMVVFVVNLVYTFTLPWHDKVWSWSPESGVFAQVPVFGNYRGNADHLVSGALFCICIGGYVLKRARWILPLLVMAQLLGIAIEQTRRMYVAIFVVIIILILLGETKKYSQLLIMLSSGIVVLILVLAAGLKITGRIGPVDMEFFKEHIRSISGAEDTPGSRVQGRLDWSEQALDHFYAHPIVGEGFGQPLLDAVDELGTVVRMPHNSSLSVLARTGVLGFVIWLAFHSCVVARFTYALRRRRLCDKQLADYILWLFFFYLLVVIDSFVEAPFEFPSMAIPFYFTTGFALGLIRRYLPDSNRREYRSSSFSNSLARVES